MSSVVRWRSSSDSDNESLTSASSSSSDYDDDDVNIRMVPNWCAYRRIIESHGFRLDTCRDVKLWYHQYWDTMRSQGCTVSKDLPGYARACSADDDSALCKDAGLPEHLFRGSRSADGLKVILRAVHIRSREYAIVRYLCSPALRNDPKNHSIPILAFIEVPSDNIVFIVMEEWSPQLVAETPCNLRLFLGALRQCIEHAAFLHSHHIAHLDISMRNILTDYQSHYAYIDYELSRRFEASVEPRIRGRRGTEVPPELEAGGVSDPYKTDVWALAKLLLRACSLVGYHIPELRPLIKSMLHPNFQQRPSAAAVLLEFDSIVSRIDTTRMMQTPSQYH
ncbi:hypothetical protein K474DRAFT_1591059 [Panus rudis PR-1116 ss-1]|nr:hypothetical protein K474DRAFT_1591059 [Panus rudis PR-1116 ss-1]